MNGPGDAPRPAHARDAAPLSVLGGLAILAVPAVLVACGLLDRDAFHALTQMACLAAGAATFLVLWNARRYLERNFFVLLGPAILAAAGIAALRVLAASGLLRLPLSAAMLQALPMAGNLGLAMALCAGAWISPQKRRLPSWAALALVAGGDLALWLLLGLARAAGPETGPSLTVLAHPAALALFAAAAPALVRDRASLGPDVVRPVLGTLTCLALAEAASTLGEHFLWPDLVGHTAKLAGYCLGCRAAVVAAVARPHQRLRREVVLRETELAARLARLGAQSQAVLELTRLKALEGGAFDDFARTLLSRAMAVLRLERASLWLLSPEGDHLVCTLGVGAAAGEAGEVLDLAGAPDYRDALAHERVLAIHDAATWPLAGPAAAALLAARGVTACIDAPLRFSGRLAGALKLEQGGGPRRFDADELAFAGNLADLLVLARESSERRLAARNLAESEQRLRSLVEAMPDPVCFKDAGGRWVVANQAILEVFGLSGEDWAGRTNRELAERCAGDRQALETLEAADFRAWTSRHPDVFGLSLTTAAGKARHFDVIKAPLFHGDGRPKGMVILGRDVTAYQNALARLGETNAELEAIYNETSDGLVIADIGSRTVVRVNAAACRMFGYDSRALTALSPWDLHPAADRERSLELFGEIAAGRLRLLEDIACLRADGTTFFADISAQSISYGGRPAILGFYRDITERRAADAALRASEERFRRVFNSTYDAIFLHDAEGRVLDLNDKALELYGLRREEALTLSIARDISAPDSPVERLREDWAAVMAGQERFFEWKARRAHDGGTFHVEVYLRRLLLDDRPVILANVRDVTERKRVLAALAARQEEITALNRSLARRVREATEKNRQKDILLLNRTRLAAMGEMIGNIAHQWRQPLNALSILLANMRFEQEAACGGETPELAAAHRQAGEILRKMSATIDDFRNFFRPDKQRETFSVVEAASDALLLIEATLAQHGVAVRFTARRNPRVVGFRGEFSQVVLNLLGNAKDAIKAHRDRGGVIAIRVMERRGMAVIHIRDNGGGIPEDALPRVFDPYFTTKSDTGGTGLGLYMSKIIIEEHMQGGLTAANVAGGARFAVRVPLAPAAPAAQPRPLSPGE